MPPHGVLLALSPMVAVSLAEAHVRSAASSKVEVSKTMRRPGDCCKRRRDEEELWRCGTMRGCGAFIGGDIRARACNAKVKGGGGSFPSHMLASSITWLSTKCCTAQ